jgi:nucleotide-binding universal stress UspA family protein
MTFKKILVPLDGSLLSETALEPALALAQAMHGEVVLLTTLAAGLELSEPEFFGLDAAPRMPLAQDATPLRERLLDYLNSICASRAGANVPMRVLVQEGDAAECIVATAVSLPADLIIMGAHGRSGMTRLLLGSVTQKVTRQACCPVLALRQPGSIQNILIVVSQNLLAEHALDSGYALAGCFDAQVHLLLPTTAEDETLSKATQSGAEEDVFRYEEAYLEDLVDRYAMNKPIITAVRPGKPETAVLSYAQTHQIDLIVLAARPYSRWRRLLYGSVSDKILRESLCSVLIVRPEKSQFDS